MVCPSVALVLPKLHAKEDSVGGNYVGTWFSFQKWVQVVKLLAMQVDNELIQATKQHLVNTVAAREYWRTHLNNHLPEVERWAVWLADSHPEANATVILLGVWLHDIGQVTGPKEVDHAVNSEVESRSFLSTVGASPDLVEKVAHCVRSHRCKDVLPMTLEARVLAAADSASHLSDNVYVLMAKRGEIEDAIAKVGRDMRDIKAFPGLVEMLEPVSQAWIGLLKVWPRIN